MIIPFGLEVVQELSTARRELENQEAEFTWHQSVVQRILATSSSTVSILFCLVAIYAFFAIDPRRLVFRHQLIAFLVFFDLLKSIILLLYPARVMSTHSAYYDNGFCQTIGFLSATSIEGADFAILSFAIHFFLLIFKPSLNTKVTDSRTEGGLYLYRYWVYGLSFLIPLILASLAFIHPSGYVSYVNWCYLPQEPIWYRLVLSWIPRYLIVIIIFSVYILIYFHVVRESKALGGVFMNIHKSNNLRQVKSNADQRPSFFSALKFFLNSVRDTIPFSRNSEPSAIERMQTSVQESRARHIGEERSRNTTVEHDSGSNDDDDDDDDDENDVDIAYDPELQVVNLVNMRKRQKIIRKQLKSIFIYPFAYCFIWLFPFILSVTQFKYESEHGPIYWLNCVGAFMQSSNGFIDSLVFFYREKPWLYTIMRTFEREHESRMDYLVEQSHKGSVSALSTMHGNSLSESFGVNVNQYSRWRRTLDFLKVPLFKLPTEENLCKSQLRYISRKAGHENHEGHHKLHHNSRKLYDYSNILGGDLQVSDFRTTLENYSLSFGKRKDSIVSSPLKSSVGSRNSLLSTAMKSEAKDFRRPSAVFRNALNSSKKPSVTDSFVKETQSSTSSDEGDHEMDFLEFLKKGPPKDMN
ncbi:uncharacterized protein PRCAT00005972001 [Priceomyces carsonii]|uniref:uncharacterized protein n=1 Tax=Priceomyces carsonii TaxID=28549 RepID=UPI002EDA915C|nr:unnamed protein product [Priceomyces carsonii]